MPEEMSPPFLLADRTMTESFEGENGRKLQELIMEAELRLKAVQKCAALLYTTSTRKARDAAWFNIYRA